MRIRLHLKIFLFVLVFLITHQIKIYGVLMFFALIHELGHMVVGILLKFKPVNLEILPYGLSIGFEVKDEDCNRKIWKGNLLTVKKIIIALAGPLTNLAIIILFLLFDFNLFGLEQELIIYSNILIGLFNLIPIYPLDGGRIVKGILHLLFGLELSFAYINKISRITVYIITIVGFVLVFYSKNLAIIIILIYLWYLSLRYTAYNLDIRKF